MKILAFDVTTPICSVALAQGPEIIAQKEIPMAAKQAELLLPTICQILAETENDWQEIDYLATTIGPGSFTGIRIGLSVAKALHLATNIKTVAVTNFELAYFRLKEQIKEVSRAYIILQAYRGQCYVQYFERGAGGKPYVIDQAELVTYLLSQEEPFYCAGSALGELYPLLKEQQGLYLLPRFARVKASHLCHLAREKIKLQEKGELKALYIRPPDAALPAK